MNLIRRMPGGSVIGLMLVLLLALMFAGPAAAQDNEDNDIYLPLLLENGDVVLGNFLDSVNAHLYGFYASAGDTVSISMVQQPEDSLLDPYLILISADGRVIDTDDDGGPVFYSALMDNVTLPEDGLYLVLATDRLGLRFNYEDAFSEMDVSEIELTYELTIAGINTPDDVDALEIDAVPLSFGEVVEFEINQTRAVGFAVFEGLEGDVISLTTLDQGDDLDTIVNLFEPEGLRLAINDDGEDLGLYSQITDAELPEDGLYLVMVTVYGFQDSYDPTLPWDQEGIVGLTLE
ncbi:MAG: hypothetical protein ACOCXZ_00460 [Chloroflexota bacterium]